MDVFDETEMERIQPRPIKISERDYIAPLKGFMWVMVDDLSVKVTCTHDEVIERVCQWYLATPFESHPDDPWGQIGLRIIHWWNAACNGQPANEDADDPRWHNYRQAIDPSFFTAITKPKS